MAMELVAAKARMEATKARAVAAEAEAEYMHLLLLHRSPSTAVPDELPLHSNGFPSTAIVTESNSTASPPPSSSVTIISPQQHSSSPIGLHSPPPPMTPLSPITRPSVRPKRRRVDTQLSTTQSLTNMPTASSSTDIDSALITVKARRSYHCQRVSEKGSAAKPSITQRRSWLLTANNLLCKGTPMTHQLQIPAWYHPELDEQAARDVRVMLQVMENWQQQQPSVVEWFTKVLKCHAVKVSEQLTIAANRRADTISKKRRQSSSEFDAAAESSRLTDEGSPTQRTSEGEAEVSSSDWEQDYNVFLNRAPAAGDDGIKAVMATAAERIVTNPNSLMTDELYVDIVKVLLHPETYLAELRDSRPSVHATIRRLFLERARYYLFWAHVDVFDSELPDTKHQRLMPVLYRVHAGVHSEQVNIDQCKRCLPISQVGWLLDRIHSGGVHLQDSHRTIALKYCGVPRKAVRLFSRKCHVCNKLDAKPRNKKPPRAIVVHEVRQRYTLDLIDMLQWQSRSSGAGKHNRFAVHIIDHSSKKRWAEAIANKTAEAVRQMVQRVFSQFGHPALLHTDNGSEFANKALEGECRRWGTYMVHGRPYHPQSQGAIENPNGFVKKAMKGWQASNINNNDWTFALAEAVRRQNAQVHSTTNMSPDEHFHKHNHYTRDVTPLRDDEAVLITVKAAMGMPRLAWLTHLRDDDDAASDDEEVKGDHDDTAPGPLSQLSPPDEDRSDRVALPQLSQRANRPTLSAQSSVTEPSSEKLAAASTTLRRSSARVNHNEPELRFLRIGAAGEFDQPEWARDLGPAVRKLLRPVGCIVNGDCGPATAHTLQFHQTASVQSASEMRRRVLDWSLTTAGQQYYANHSEAEVRQVPAPLDRMQEIWRTERAWVTTEFFSCFGGMNKLNVFMLSRTINREGAVHCGIFIITNGGTLVQTDDENCVCIHYQSKWPEDIGHWEPVQDRQRKWRWSVDSEVVQNCLWLACQRLKVSRSVRDSRKKMLVAANNRINSSNEVINQGDFAWLTVPDAVVKSVAGRIRRRKGAALQIAAEHKMLVKVSRVYTLPPDDEEPSTTASQQFVLWCADGRLKGAYPIDQLRLCAPAPESSHYPLVSMEVPVGDQPPPGLVATVKLTKAYYKYVTFLSTRSAIAVENRSKRERERQRAIGSASVAAAAAAAAEVDEAGGDIGGWLADDIAEADDDNATESDSSLTRSLLRSSSNDVVLSSGEENGHARYPCVHCEVEMEWKDYVFCFYKPCAAPFHKPGVGCSKQEKVVRVNDKLLYCRQACAQYDRGSASIAAPSLPAPAPAPAAALSRSLSLTAATTRSQREDERTIALSQPTSVTAAKKSANAAAATTHRLICRTCQQQLVQWRKGMSCDRCRGYHCRVKRGQEGCKRAGWSKGGSRLVEGMLECVECRFAGNAEWIAFNNSRLMDKAAERSGQL